MLFGRGVKWERAPVKVEGRIIELVDSHAVKAGWARWRALTGAARPVSAHWPCWLFSISIFFSSSCFSASKLNVAPFCIGGYCRKVWAALLISCCT